MQQPEFNLGASTWDAFNAFHVDAERPNGQYKTWHTTKPAFTLFDTGELIVTTNNFDPSSRRARTDLHVDVWSTTDEKCPPLFIPSKDFDKAVPKAWLNRKGGQTILIDHDHKVVVSLEHNLKVNDSRHRGNSHLNSDKTWREMVPERLREQCYAYYAGPRSAPIGYPIRLMPPRALGDADKKRLNEIIASCKAWCELDTETIAERNIKHPPLDIDTVLKLGLEGLFPGQRQTLARNGLGDEFDTNWEDYLTVK